MESVSKTKRWKEECKRSRTRRINAEAQKKCDAVHIEVKQNTKRNKVEFYNALLTQTEEAAAHGNMKDLYDTSRK